MKISSHFSSIPHPLFVYLPFFLSISLPDTFLSEKENFIHILTFVSRIVSSFLLSLHKISCIRQFESKLSLRSFAFFLPNRTKSKNK